MPYIRLSRTVLYYDDAGTGPAILFLPGLGATHTLWTPQREAFATTHRAIAPDPRGTGGSGELAGFSRMLERQAADLAELLDRLDIARTAVCGVSYGGLLGQRFALDYPERCAALVVTDSYSRLPLDGAGDLAILAGAYLIAPALLLPPRLLAPGVRWFYRKWPLAADILGDSVRNLRGYEAMKLRLRITGLDYLPELGRLRCPILGIVGTAQPLIVRYMRRFAESAGARLVEIPDAVDPSNLCRPDEFNQAVRDFLTEIGWTTGENPSPATG